VTSPLTEKRLAALSGRAPFASWTDRDAALARFQRASDETMIRVAEEFRDLPHTRYAGDPEDFRHLIREMLRTTSLAPGSFDDSIPHEMEHAAAAQAFGCATRFAFSVVPLPDGLCRCYASTEWISPRPVSKLAMAAFIAAPAVPSDGDLRDLLLMGYLDAADVAERIRRCNRTAQYPLPVPKGR
jgi:hypothetical protein